MAPDKDLKLEGIIFDVDGTLADTEEVHRIAFNRTFEEFGLAWRWSEEIYADLLSISGGKERLTAFGSDLRNEFQNDSIFHNFIAEMHIKKSENYRKLISERKIKLRTGVRRLVMEGRSKKISLNLATSSSFANIDTLLRPNFGSNWRELFHVIESSDTTKEKKPHPAVYENVLKKSALNASRVIAIEDTQNGLDAACKASLKTIVTIHPMTAKNSFDESSFVIDCMGEPDEPFNVLSGNNFGHSFLNLTLMEKILNQQ